MSTQGKHLLVVDDDPKLRELLRRYLAENQFEVSLAQDGPAMNRLLQRQPVDLIVLDLMLPGEDGLSIVRRLRGGGDTTPVIMLTAKGDDIDRIVGLEMGADDYIAKPFNPRELLARIDARAAPAARGRPARRTEQRGCRDRVRRVPPEPRTAHARAQRGARAADQRRVRSAQGVRQASEGAAVAGEADDAWPAAASTRPSTAASTSRSPGCASFSRPTRSIRATCRPSGESGTCSSPTSAESGPPRARPA